MPPLNDREHITIELLNLAIQIYVMDVCTIKITCT